MLSRRCHQFRDTDKTSNSFPHAPPWILRAKDPRIKDRGICSYKFVDDSVNTSPVNMRSAALLENEGELFKQIKDKRTESLLHHIASTPLPKECVLTQLKQASCVCPRRPRSSHGSRLKWTGSRSLGQLYENPGGYA